MPFKMKVNKQENAGNEPVPPGIYTVQFIGFKPKTSAKGDSINLNGMAKIVSHPEYANKTIFANLNTQIFSFIEDFVHSFGLAMDGADADEIPGDFASDPAKFKEDDPSTWAYKGPLISQTAQWELGIREYNGAPTQDIVKFICKVPQCAERFPKVRHSKDMRKKG